MKDTYMLPFLHECARRNTTSFLRLILDTNAVNRGTLSACLQLKKKTIVMKLLSR